MGKDIRRGTAENLWTNVEVSGKGFWTYAHLELNGVPARMRLDSVSSRYSDPAPAPFAEGEEIIVAGKMDGDTFRVQMAYLPERNQAITPPHWLIAPLIGLAPIGLGLLYVVAAIKSHANFGSWLIVLMPIAMGLYFIALGLDQRETEKYLKAATQGSA